MIKFLASILLCPLVMGQQLTNETCVHECLAEESGLFAQGCCEPTYCQCYGGVGEVYSCEEDQMFNEEIQNCDWMWHIPCCNETLIVPTTPPTESCQLSTCEEDGYFGEGSCEADFCQCIGGTGHLLHCQPGLFYNEVTHVCDWPWNIQGCLATSLGPETTTGAASTDGTDSSVTTPDYSNGTDSSVTTPDSTDGTTTVGTTMSNDQCETDCTGLDNGFYTEGCCESTYCQCFHGEGILQTCPGGSVFNEEAGFCDDSENVACCDPTDLPTTTFPPATSTAGTDECEYDCSGQEDGAFPEGCCLPSFCVCTEGVGAIHDCNNGTVFDDIAGFCHNPNNIECCQHTTTMLIFK